MTNFRLGTAVKKGIALFPILGIFFLPACGALRLMLEVPTQVEIDGNTYITGFYGDDLWPTGLSFTGEECEVEGNLFRFMDWEPFNCVQAPIGWKTSGTIYCLSSQWEEAEAYYGDPENNSYYCMMNSKYGQDEKTSYEIKDMDFEKYEELRSYGSKFSYALPADLAKRMAEFKIVTFDTQKVDPQPYFTFYRDSEDGHFTSTKGDHFFILNGKLYLSGIHDRDSGGNGGLFYRNRGIPPGRLTPA